MIDARQVQKVLRFLGYEIAVDGIWGAESQAALNDAAAQDVTDINVGNNGSGWDDIRYFKREEFRCKCGGKYCGGFPAEPAMKLLREADKVREHFGAPATVTSGLRCEKWNAIQGGVPTSRHRLGTAMDFCIRGVSGAMLDAYVGTLPNIAYHYNIPGTDCVHMDVIL